MPYVIAAMFAAAGQLFTGLNPVYMLIGGFVGVTFGMIPGMSGIQALALLIPFSFGMSPLGAMVMMGACQGSVNLGGAIPSILINTPGTSTNIATCFDGYPMAKKGMAGQAIGAVSMGSFLGMVCGVIILIALIPLVSAVIMSFGPPEFFLLAMMGISAIAFLTRGNMFRNLFAGALGLMLSFVGYDPITSTMRFTMGALYLYDGIQYVPFVIGLFAISEAITLGMSGKKPVARVVTETKFSHIMEGVKAPFKHLRIFFQSVIIGHLVGIIPGIGGTVATMLSWSVGAQTAPKGVKFGTGVIEGVIATETANNAKTPGDLLPTVAFGIPGGAEMAVLLGAFILHGMVPGPALLTTNLHLVWAIVLAYLGSSLVTSLITISISKYLVRISYVSGFILAPLIVMLCLAGSYILRLSIWDTLVCLSAGILGYFMNKWRFNLANVAIGLVLGSIAEKSFGQSLMISDSGLLIFFTRPVSLVLVLIILSMLFFAVILPRLRKD